MNAKPPTLHIEIDAVWHNGKWRVVDANGSPCQALTSGVFSALLPKRTRASGAGLPATWSDKLQKMRSHLNGYEQAAKVADPWKKRLASMCAMIREREPSRRPARERTQVGLGWPARFAAMKRNLTSEAKRDRQLKDEWTAWARGRASGMQKRYARRSDGREATDIA